MTLSDRPVIATDDLGRPVYGPRIVTEKMVETPMETVALRPDAWNCGAKPPVGSETKAASGLKRRNPGLAFATTHLPQQP